MARIRACANNGCGAEFVPRCNRQLWCGACLADPEALRRRDREYKRRQRQKEKGIAEPSRRKEMVFRALGGGRIASLSSWRGLAVAPDGTVGKFCRGCGEFFPIRNVRQVRCPECQETHRKRRLAAYQAERRKERKEGEARRKEGLLREGV
jgi:hypothetical protein